MNQLKRMRPNSPWLLVCSMSALISMSAQAGIVVPKPAPHGSTTMSPEMGHVLTRFGNYTLAGTPLETVGISGEVIVAEPSQQQGVVYLFNGASATPERVYQFPGVAHTMEFAGFKVAMSNQWAAFASKVYYYQDAPNPIMSYVYIAGKTNGVWASCPTLDSVPNNCNNSFRDNLSSLSRPITRIAFGDRGTARDDFDASRFSMDISDKYLVLADSKKSIVKFYRYDAASANWMVEFELDDDDYKTFGKAVAISGERIAVSSTWEGNPAVSNGKVRIYQRNANSTWSMASQVDGNFGTGNFGNNLKMDSNTLVVASGASGLNGSGTRQLVFFPLNSIGNPTGESHVVTVPNLNKMSLSGDTLAVSNFPPSPAVTIYSRNTASASEWKLTTGLTGEFYNNLNRVGGGGGLTGQDDVGLVGDDLSLGWRVFNPEPNNRFMGAVVHEKVSLLDTCRDPKNLVINCSFDNVNNTTFNGSASSANWTLLNHQGGSSTASYTGRQLRVSISNAGYDMWHIQARTPVNLSQAVRYKLTFRAKADANRSFVVNIGHNGNQDNNWQSYGRENVYATTNWTDYSYEFQVPMDANAFLDFNLGNAGTSAVNIDSVSLKAF